MNKNNVLFLILSICTFCSYSQVGVGTKTPDNSSILELKSTSKGFLPPRIALNSRKDTTTISKPTKGLMIYNTASSGTAPYNVTPGYYYFDSSSWVHFNTDNIDVIIDFDSVTNPNLSGATFSPNIPQNSDVIYTSTIDNSSWKWNGSSYVAFTPTSTTWLQGGNMLSTFRLFGTRSYHDLPFITNNTERIRILASNGNVGIGTASPTSKLQVIGGINFRNSTNTNSVTFSEITGQFNLVSGPATLQQGGFVGSTFNSLINNTAYIAALTGASQLGFNTQSSIPIIFCTNDWIERMRIQPTTGNVGINTIIPGNKLEIAHGVSGNSGLRFTNLNSMSTASNSSGKVLSVNSSGDVILENLSIGSTNIIASSMNVANNTSLIFEGYEIRYNSTTNNFEARVTTGTKVVSYLSEHEYPGGSFSIGNTNLTLSSTWQTIGDGGIVDNERQVVLLTSPLDNMAYRYTIQRITSSNVTMFAEKIGVNSTIVSSSTTLTGAFNASLNTNFTLTTTPQAIPFNVNNENFGTISHSTTTNNTRFTFTRTGYYEIIVVPQITRIAAGEAILWIKKNGNTDLVNTAIRAQYSSNGDNRTEKIIASGIFNANEFIEIMGFSTTASSYNLQFNTSGIQNLISFPTTPAAIINIKGFFN